MRYALPLAAALLAPSATAADADANAGNALAGRYFGTLPDAGCASLDVLLTLEANGHYTLQSYCQDDLASQTTQRTWAATWHGTCLELAPAGPAQPHRAFAIHDEGLLVLATGGCLEPVDDPRGRTLRRADDAPRSG